MRVIEVGGGLLWAASGVAVAGFTYEAYRATYQPFPMFGGGTAAPSNTIPQTAAARAASKASAQHSFGPFSGIAGLLNTVAMAPLKLLGLYGPMGTPTGSLSRANMRALNRPLPANIQADLQAMGEAVRQGNATLATRLWHQNVAAISTQPGLAQDGPLEAMIYLNGRGLLPQFSRLTKIKFGLNIDPNSL